MKSHGLCMLLALIIIMTIPMVVLAQTQERESVPNVAIKGESRTVTAGVEAPFVTVNWLVELDYPHEVQRFRVFSSDSTTLTASIANNGATDGDRWKATVQIWDDKPSIKTATCSGDAGVYSKPVTMNNHGKTPLQARVEVRYYKGNNTFPASAMVKFEGDGSTITVTNLGISDF